MSANGSPVPLKHWRLGIIARKQHGDSLVAEMLVECGVCAERYVAYDVQKALEFTAYHRCGDRRFVRLDVIQPVESVAF